MKKPITILAIESSCDETSAAVSENDVILSNIIASQDVHRSFGGVVPELASRAHQQNIIPVIDSALKASSMQKQNLDAVAFTRGPGLMGSLLVGVSFAKAFALALGIPIIEVNHMQAHVLAHLIKHPEQKNPSFPFLCLTVSGGHTQLVKVESPYALHIIGQTRDDAAGEAFDKISRIIGLPYPGGPLIDKLAQDGDRNRFRFPHPQMPGYDYSFSGIKTSVLNFLRDEMKNDNSFIEKNKTDICASVQRTIVDILFSKLIKAAEETGITEIAIAGGVSANSELRSRLAAEGNKRNWNVCLPRFEYCTDNAAMIAIAGYYKFLKNDFASQDITPLARYAF